MGTSCESSKWLTRRILCSSRTTIERVAIGFGVLVAVSSAMGTTAVACVSPETTPKTTAETGNKKQTTFAC